MGDAVGGALAQALSPAADDPAATVAQPFVSVAPRHKRFDRCFDVAVAVALLVVLAPVMGVIAAAIRVDSRGPALFRQVRIGRHGAPFEVLKFRTMAAGSDDSVHRLYIRREYLHPDELPQTSDGAYKLEVDVRVTRVGRFLRRTSIDELPQLINVVRGDMALVGPRPLPDYECDLHDAYHRQRCLTRPGLTGLWQVSGRNRLTTREMLDLDVRYVDERSWALDLELLARTPAAVLRRDGAR